MYDFSELDHIDEGLTPTGFDEDITVLDGSINTPSFWDVGHLMSAVGISSV
jgi:hypothetical protein